MGVDVYSGSPAEFVSTGSQTLGAAAGRAFSLNNIGWCNLATLGFVLTATATVGNRNIGLRFFDAQGNRLLETTTTTAQTASTVDRYFAGGSLAIVGSQGVITLPIPTPLLLPPGSTFNILDENNIDPNDAVSAVIGVYTQ